jgi:tetratricopeptide (TPR) repeat protein
MWKRLLGIVIMLALTGTAFADYIVDRKAAMTLYKARKYEEACAAFVKLAEGEVTDVQKSDALRQAVNCAYRMKQYDKAMEFAKQMPVEAESKAAQLMVMCQTRKWKEAIAKFKAEDIAPWPDHVKYEAYHSRGISAYRTKNADLAVADLNEAVKHAKGQNNRALALLNLGNVYKDLVKDDDKALETFRLVLAEKHIYKGSSACIAMSGIYLKQGKPQEAMAALDWPDMNKLNGMYKAMILAERARVLAAMDKKAEAIAKYKEALAVKGLSKYLKKKYEAALKQLDGGEAK